MDQILIEEMFDQDLFYYSQNFLQIKQIQYQDLLHVNPENELKCIQKKLFSFKINLQDENFHMEEIYM